MALKLIEYGSPDYQKMISLRDNVLRKPLGLIFSPGELEEEKENILIGAFEDEDLLGCCMLVEENARVIRLRQILPGTVAIRYSPCMPGKMRLASMKKWGIRSPVMNLPK